VPNLRRLAVIAREVADIMVVTKPPPLVQQSCSAHWRRSAEPLGYRAIHPEYRPAAIARSRPTPAQRDRTP
jgi:hypothetical protein